MAVSGEKTSGFSYPLLADAWVQALLLEGDRLCIGTADGLYLAEGGQIEKVRGDDMHPLYKTGETLWVGTLGGLLGLHES